MKAATSINIQAAHFARCSEIVEKGEFDSISEVVDFALRLFYYHLKFHGANGITHIPRIGPKKKISLRVNDWVMDGFSNLGILTRAEVFDYALDYFFSMRDDMINTDSDIRTRRYDLGRPLFHIP